MDGRVVVITSGKGGVGKTTSVANLGTALAQRQKKVLLIDTDIGLRNLDVVMGLENRVIYTLVDVVENTCKIKQAIIKDKRFPNLFLMPAAQTRDKTAVNPEQMKKLCATLKDDFDFILIDSPAGIEQGFKNAIAGANEAVIVTTPHITAIRDADRVAGFLDASLISNYRLLINRVQHQMVLDGEMLSPDHIKEILSVEICGIIPEDNIIVTTMNKGEYAVSDPRSIAGQAFLNTAERLLGNNVDFVNLEDSGGFFSKVGKKIFRWS